LLAAFGPPNARRTQGVNISEPRINERIRVPEVRLIGPLGEQVGVVKLEVAQRFAREADLDLVEVAPEAKPPVVKIMDFGKFKYEAAQKAKEARRNQVHTALKEVRFRLKIDTHDYATKVKHAMTFLKGGDKVKAMIQFRGREQSRPEAGVRLLHKFAEEVAEYGTVEHSPTVDGRNMTMVIAPLKTKVDAKAEAAKAKAEPAEAPAEPAVKAPAVAKAPAAAKAPATKAAAQAPAVAKAPAEPEAPAVATPAPVAEVEPEKE
jgi:translation initiation factor IF-3